DPEVVELAARVRAARPKRDDLRRAEVPPDDRAEEAAREGLDSLLVGYIRAWQARSDASRARIEATGAVIGPDQELREAEARVRSLKVRRAALRAEAERMDVVPARQPVDAVD